MNFWAAGRRHKCLSTSPCHSGRPAEMVDFVLAERAARYASVPAQSGADADTDVARVRAVVEATGEGDTIVADANGGWRLAEAVQAVGMLEGTPRLRIEQPAGRSKSACRYAAGPRYRWSSTRSSRTCRRYCGPRASGPSKASTSRSAGSGAPTGACMRDVCVELGVDLLIEDTWGGDLCSAAVAALAGSTSPSALWAASFMNDWTLEHLAGYQPRSAGGWGPVPMGPASASWSTRTAWRAPDSSGTPMVPSVNRSVGPGASKPKMGNADSAASSSGSP